MELTNINEREGVWRYDIKQEQIIPIDQTGCSQI